MLIHASLCSSQEPQNSFDDEIRNEPAQSALGNRPMYVGCLEEIGDEAIDGQSTAKGLAKDLESTELFGKGEETGAKAHCHRLCIGLD